MSHDNNKYLGLCSGLLVNTIMASSSLLRWTFNCLLAVCLIASFCQFLMLVYFIDIISLYIILLYSNIFAGDQLQHCGETAGEPHHRQEETELGVSVSKQISPGRRDPAQGPQ